MLFFFEVLVVQRVDQLIGHFRAHLFLKKLDHAVSLQGVGDGAAKFVGDAGGGAVGCHEGCVHLHFLFRVAISSERRALAGVLSKSNDLMDRIFGGEGRTWISCTIRILARLLGWLPDRAGRGSRLS